MTTKLKTAKRKCGSRKSIGEKGSPAGFCPICGKPATKSVDGEPSCDEHVEQVYEHQVEDYTINHLIRNEWRKN
jgi:hypothetical protein